MFFELWGFYIGLIALLISFTTYLSFNFLLEKRLKNLVKFLSLIGLFASIYVLVNGIFHIAGWANPTPAFPNANPNSISVKIFPYFSIIAGPLASYVYLSYYFNPIIVKED